LPLEREHFKKINELLDLDIIEKVSGPTTWVRPAVYAPSRKMMMLVSVWT